jgi:hypothetical protein
MTIGSLAMKTLAAILVLFTLASSAAAECAWVLWASGIQNNTHIPDYPMDSFTSLEECKKDAALVRKRKDARTGDLLNTVCLPDTVDPRGAKGGGR